MLIWFPRRAGVGRRSLGVCCALACATACLWMARPERVAAATAATAPATQPLAFNSPKERISYFVGMKIAEMLKQQGLDVDVPAFSAGVGDTQAGKTPQLTPDQLEQTRADMQKMGEEKRAAAASAADKNKTEGEAFLTANGKKDGVTTLPSGLEYKVLATGKGKQPAASDTVTVNYSGSLLDGTVFDKSDPGMPATFQIDGLIPAWKEALVKMHEGDHWLLFVPASLAYGPEGSGPIPPNSVLIFDMELLKVK